VPLREREYEGILVRRCPACRGVLLEQGQEQRILARREERFPPRLVRKAREFRERNRYRPRPGQTEGPLPALYRCPGCGHPMSRSLYSYQYFVEVDRCHGCRLVWFDGDELEVLQILVEEAGLP
jgi:Zn-finger nucleic acid-binding protein